MTVRELYEKREREILSPFAVCASDSKGRSKAMSPCPLRTCFQRDIDRITHSKAFRRLKHKTQVFLQPEGDHYRTRMTHTLEVSRIARTISRALGLNEDLTEAIACGHDLGHTPFGHAGERALNEIYPGGFRHNEQSLRVVDVLEDLNLSYEVRMGILCHTGERDAESLEANVVKIADRIAYINHDVDDAIRAGILKNSYIPTHISDAIGTTYGERIDSFIKDVIENSTGKRKIAMTDAMSSIMEEFRDFMFEMVYRNPVAKGEESKAEDILKSLYAYYVEHPNELPEDYLELGSIERSACDYVGGMTDTFAVWKYSELFIPSGWQAR